MTDFGLAKVLDEQSELTVTGASLGTPRYMSPEQIQGRNVDGRSDIFSLGVTLYEMLTGQPAFDGDTPLALMYQIVHESFPAVVDVNPNVSTRTAEMLVRMTARDPGDRYASAADVCVEIDALLQTPLASIPIIDIDLGESAPTPGPALAAAPSRAGAPSQPASNASSWSAILRTPNGRRGLAAIATVVLVALIIAGVTSLMKGPSGAGLGTGLPEAAAQEATVSVSSEPNATTEPEPETPGAPATEPGSESLVMQISEFPLEVGQKWIFETDIGMDVTLAIVDQFTNSKGMEIFGWRLYGDMGDIYQFWGRTDNAVYLYISPEDLLPQGVFRFPLRAGAKWEYDYYSSPDNRDADKQKIAQAYVAPEEQVQVPAGEFTTLRVKFPGNYDFWLVPNIGIVKFTEKIGGARVFSLKEYQPAP